MAYSMMKSAPKKTKSSAKPVQRRTSEIVANAIKNLNERGGSSLRAIKKYMAANYGVDTEQLSPFIKEYLKTAVAAGKLVQTTGKGATGFFKLAASKSKKAAVPTAPVRGRRGLSSAPKQKKSNPPEIHKAKSRQKAAVKSRATPNKSPSKAKHRAQILTKTLKVPRTKTPGSPRHQKGKTE